MLVVGVSSRPASSQRRKSWTEPSGIVAPRKIAQVRAGSTSLKLTAMASSMRVASRSIIGALSRWVSRQVTHSGDYPLLPTYRKSNC